MQLEHGSRIDETPIALGQHASMRFLHANGTAHSSANENSLVVRLDLGTSRVLLVGDAEAGGRKPPTTPPSAQSIEGVLVTCCASELSAQVLVVGHHGSRTSSRTAFLDAIGASVFIVSSGPTKYNSVTLPDLDVVAELSQRGVVFRTDDADAACAANEAKIGPDADGQPGGCTNIRVAIGADVRAAVFMAAEQ